MKDGETTAVSVAAALKASKVCGVFLFRGLLSRQGLREVFLTRRVKFFCSDLIEVSLGSGRGGAGHCSQISMPCLGKACQSHEQYMCCIQSYMRALPCQKVQFSEGKVYTWRHTLRVS